MTDKVVYKGWVLLILLRSLGAYVLFNFYGRSSFTC